ncbi:protein starmaker-like [Solanum pennellii]|nr:protein starmaker-like [Solanum pennellii]
MAMEVNEEKPVMEVKIEEALRSRIQHFKDNADSFTLERVRRLIEEDLELEKYALDVHKRFIKQILEKLMENAAADGVPKDSQENLEKDASLTEQEKEVLESPKKQVIKKDIKEPALDQAEMDDSPIMGVMSSKSESVDAQSLKVSESSIKKAIWERADHFRDNSESITLAGVRRLLEEDLGLEKNSLDAFKKFIHNQIDEVLIPSEAPKSSSVKKSPENKSKTAKKSGENSNSSSKCKRIAEKVKSGKNSAAKETVEKSEGLKKRKKPNSEDNVPAKKQKEVSKNLSDEDSDGDTDKSDSEDGQSGSSAEIISDKEKVVKGASANTGYGKRVEHLKSIFKACGMSVAPFLYKRAKQVSDDKREGFLIKELEKMLSAEGLSSNPTEKEIKEVKKRKQTAKELEGIDLSNIVSNTRRRSTTSFVDPPRPKSPPKNDKNDDKDGDSDADGASDDDKDDDDDEDDESSQSDEEFNGDDDEDSE